MAVGAALDLTQQQLQLLWGLACEGRPRAALQVLKSKARLALNETDAASQLPALVARQLLHEFKAGHYLLTPLGVLALLRAEAGSPSKTAVAMWHYAGRNGSPPVTVLQPLLSISAIGNLATAQPSWVAPLLGYLCQSPLIWNLLPRLEPEAQLFLQLECWIQQLCLGAPSVVIEAAVATLAQCAADKALQLNSDLPLLGLAPLAADDPFGQPVTAATVLALWPEARLNKPKLNFRTLYEVALLALYDLPRAQLAARALIKAKRWPHYQGCYVPRWLEYLQLASAELPALQDALAELPLADALSGGPTGPLWGELLLIIPLLLRVQQADSKGPWQRQLRQAWQADGHGQRLLNTRPATPVMERVQAGLAQLMGEQTASPFVLQQPQWQRWLTSLEQAMNRTVAVEADERLVWQLAADWQSLMARLQKRGAKGWQKGRVVALWDLRYRRNLALSATDQQLLSQFQAQHEHYIGPHQALRVTPDVARLLPQCACLLDSDGEELNVIAEHPLLLLEAVAQQLRLSIFPHMGRSLLTPRSNGVLAFVDMSEETVRLLELVERMPGGFPADQHLVLEAQLARLDGLGWYSDVSGQGNISLQPWDERPHLWLNWKDGRLSIAMRHQPVDPALAGLSQQSGTGPEWQPLPAAKGQWFKRELKQEMASSLSLLKQLELPTVRDRQWQLDGEAAIAFLDKLASLPQLPLHWRGTAVSVVGSDKLALAISSQQDWFAVSGEIVVDQQQVVELRTLLNVARSGYIQLASGATLLLSQQLRRQLRLLDSVLDADQRVEQRLAYPLSQLLASFEHGGDQGWQALSQRWQEKPLLAPELLEPLRDYQRTAVQWAAHLAMHQFGACLADDMGLGKTLQALTLIRHFGVDGASLVVAPKSVVGNWLAEAARFAPELQLIDLESAADREQEIVSAGPRQVVVLSYGLLPRLEQALHQRQWQVAVLDEAQQIKNASTKRANTAFQLNAHCRFALSGTPIENHLGELWSLFAFINPGLLGNKTQFNRRYGNAATNAEELWRLRALVGPFIMRRSKQQVLTELPAKTEITHHVELSTAERTAYEAVRKEALAQAKVQGQGLVAILAGLTRLRQLCCDQRLLFPQHKQPGSKLEEALLLVQEALENGRRVLVFSQFVSLLKLFMQPLEAAAIDYCYLDGQCTTGQRRKAIERFKTGGVPLFLISLKAGGTGLNLTEADTVIHLDPWWNPAVEDQASDRAHRMGQTQAVTVYRLVARDTVEDKIVQMHRDKRELADKILDGQNDAKGLNPELLLSLMGD